MHSIKLTHKPAWILSPTVIFSIHYVIITGTTEYTYDDKNIIIREGVFTKHQKTIPLYRIIDIQARRNILGYGTVTVADKASVTKLRLVAKPLEVAKILQTAKEQAQSNQNIVHNEIF